MATLDSRHLFKFNKVRKMQRRAGISLIVESAVREIRESAKNDRVVLFEVATGELPDGRRFFEAIRSAFPLDPPLVGSKSWDALQDSLFEGLSCLAEDTVVIIWADAPAFRMHARADYDIAISVLQDLTDQLADPSVTAGEPKQVSVFVVQASGSD